MLSLVDPTPRVLRPGAVTREQLAAALGCAVEGPVQTMGDSATQLLSPGLLAKHYSPRTPVMLRSALRGAGALPKKIGAILFSPQELPFEPACSVTLSASGDLAEVAARLFAALRDLDSQQLDLIVVDTCEPVGLGEAIMDRLIRASARL